MQHYSAMVRMNPRSNLIQLFSYHCYFSDIDDESFISNFKLLRSCYLHYSDSYPFKYKLKQEIVCNDVFSERGFYYQLLLSLLYCAVLTKW